MNNGFDFTDPAVGVTAPAQPLLPSEDVRRAVGKYHCLLHE